MSLIEDIILRYSGRGMDVLRPALPDDFCHKAARAMLDLPLGNILITTGFCVGMHPGTDGPAGSIAVANALKRLGYTPVFVTDVLCEGIFESEGYQTVYFPMDGTGQDARDLLEEYQPVALFSLERCGRNSAGDYSNMRGNSIREHTAPADLLFPAAAGRILTVGVGDGGNEIGMGNLASVIAEKLAIVPCAVEVDCLVIATVSNWGGYGLCACLEQLTGLELTPSYETIRGFLERASVFGCVDGISGLPALTEDGFPEQTTREILCDLQKAVR